MKTIKGFRVWQIIYPIALYYVVSSIAYFALALFMGENNETYMLRQMICSAVTIPFTMSFYKSDKAMREVVYGKEKRKLDASYIKDFLFTIISAMTLGIAVNNILAMTPLMQYSAGFQEANTAFFAGTFLMELLGSCLVIPIAEELLFRGVVFGRIRILLGAKPAIVFSAILFGILHVNLVQFLYAAILGLLLAFLVEKTGKLSMAVWGHIGANVVAVVRSETGWLEFSYSPTGAGIGFTLVMVFVSVLVIGFMIKEMKDKTKEM